MTRFTKILVHTDVRQEAHPALECAIELAKTHKARLALLDVIPEFTWPARLLVGNAERIVEQVTNDKFTKLRSLREKTERRGVVATTVLLDAPTSVSLIREAQQGNYDLVIKETKGRASRRSGLFGTTATRLLRKCPCPLLLLKPGRSDARFKHIVAAVDATSEDEIHAQLNEEIVELAKTICASHQLDIVHAWSVLGESLLKEHMNEEEFELVLGRAKAHAEAKLDELVSRFGMGIAEPTIRVLHGDAAERIPKLANQAKADLLVLGTIGRSGVSGLMMGNTAERILDKVDCSILAVKPAGFSSPIRMDDRRKRASSVD